MYDYIIIGAGIVGLTTALKFAESIPGVRLLILEKEASYAGHQTGHNSGVIHAGLYYKPDSLKAKFCRVGLQQTVKFCADNNINFKKTGKLIVATDESELEELNNIYNNAIINQTPVQMYSKKLLADAEPFINGVGAIFSPNTSIVSYKDICQTIVNKLRNYGVNFRFNEKVLRITEDGLKITVVTENERYDSKFLIACAGLQSDRIAKLNGHDPDFRIVPFRGEYHILSDRFKNFFNHLIYPVPNPKLPFLGIHITNHIDGSVSVGPNAVLSFARESYSSNSINIKDAISTFGYSGFWKLIGNNINSVVSEMATSISKTTYLKACNKYCDSIKLYDFVKYKAGIRAQAVSKSGILIHDFLFLDSPRSLHVCNTPSPAATSAFPIADHIFEKATLK